MKNLIETINKIGSLHILSLLEYFNIPVLKVTNYYVSYGYDNSISYVLYNNNNNLILLDSSLHQIEKSNLLILYYNKILSSTDYNTIETLVGSIPQNKINYQLDDINFETLKKVLFRAKEIIIPELNAFIQGYTNSTGFLINKEDNITNMLYYVPSLNISTKLLDNKDHYIHKVLTKGSERVLNLYKSSTINDNPKIIVNCISDPTLTNELIIYQEIDLSFISYINKLNNGEFKEIFIHYDKETELESLLLKFQLFNLIDNQFNYSYNLNNIQLELMITTNVGIDKKELIKIDSLIEQSFDDFYLKDSNPETNLFYREYSQLMVKSKIIELTGKYMLYISTLPKLEFLHIILNTLNKIKNKTTITLKQI